MIKPRLRIMAFTMILILLPGISLSGFARINTRSYYESEVQDQISVSNEDSIIWVNPLDNGAEVFGCGYPEIYNSYNRFPPKAKDLVPPSVWGLSLNSAGLSIRFFSNASDIIVRYSVEGGQGMFHMPPTGVSGIDLLCVTKKGTHHNIAPNFPVKFDSVIEYRYSDISYFEGDYYEYRMYLPLYNTISHLEIGVPEGAMLEFKKIDRNIKPVVVYGTSITQGACASRPAQAWVTLLSEEFDIPFVNLGFSGSGKCEAPVFDLISEIDACAYIIDCVANLNEIYKNEDITKRISYGVHQIRASHPDSPIILAEYGGFNNLITVKERITDYNNVNNMIASTYKKLKSEGITNLYYIKADMNTAGEDGYVEGLHPNDLGMHRIADCFKTLLKKILK